MNPITPEQAEEALALVRAHGGLRPASRASGIRFTTLRRRYQRALNTNADKGEAIDVEPVHTGRIHAIPRTAWPVPSKGKVNRYIFTSAQADTFLHEGVWQNVQAMAQHYQARICISTFTYDLASYGPASVKRGKAKGTTKRNPTWAPEIEPYICDESIVVAPGLVWCGEMNILPTAVRPLAGLESYTGRKSGIFPHAKIALESVASGKFEGTKINYTTGTVTQRNYIAKKAGLKAEFHHGYGGLLVEVDSDGAWFCRQLNADSEGTLHDLTLEAKNGKVLDKHTVEAINWGDLHVGTVDRDTFAMQWGENGMLWTLAPRVQFFHDVLDFRSRNHHDMRNPHKMFQKHIEGTDDVADEMKQVADFIEAASTRYCRTVIVDSNHDNALTRWLREADYRNDPKNALFFLEAQLEMYRSIADRKRSFHMLEWAMRKMGVGADIRFLHPDESYIICPDANGGIECGMHGHLGVDGSRGNLGQFAKMGRKTNTGHSHRAEIRDGAYCAGVTGAFDQGYNQGPSTWTRSHIVTYRNGKRAIVTCWGNKWRA